MLQVLSLLIVLGVVLIIGRLATVALTATGIPREIAKFQARSALTGAGFTTTESEQIVGHPARRRIVMILMMTGAIGGAAGIATTITAFANVNGYGQGLVRDGMLTAGLFAGVVLIRTRWFDRLLMRLFAGLIKRVTDVDLTDYAGLLRLSGDYGIAEILVDPGDWWAERELADLNLNREGVLLLGVVRPDQTYIGAPTGSTRLHPGDLLLAYGRGSQLAELDKRSTGEEGERAHLRAVAEHREHQRGDDGWSAAPESDAA